MEREDDKSRVDAMMGYAGASDDVDAMRQGQEAMRMLRPAAMQCIRILVEAARRLGS